MGYVHADVKVDDSREQKIIERRTPIGMGATYSCPVSW